MRTALLDGSALAAPGSANSERAVGDSSSRLPAPGTEFCVGLAIAMSVPPASAVALVTVGAGAPLSSKVGRRWISFINAPILIPCWSSVAFVLFFSSRAAPAAAMASRCSVGGTGGAAGALGAPVGAGGGAGGAAGGAGGLDC